MESVVTRRRKTLPDVPEDISIDEHLAHLNDPNYPFEDTESWDDYDIESGPPTDTYGEKTMDYSEMDSTSYSRSSSRIATSRAPFGTTTDS